MFAWLIEGGIGPALVALPVNWAGQVGAGAARRWFRRLRRSDDLSRLVMAATGISVDLSRDQFDAVRRLLEDERTWALAGRGTVEDLVALVAACLQENGREPTVDMRFAAASIARGLLEFGVADVDPELFQRLLFARLGRMEANQATRIDEVMLGFHADVAAWFAAAAGLDDRRSRDVMGHLRQILDRVPPARADRGELAVYLNTLISWLATDSWPRDQRFAGPELDVAAVERKLRVAIPDEPELDADDLAAQCQRLVILGGPGSGKTWLARRTARRCAERALEALAAGGRIDELEFPLYTTCSQLFSADGDIRQAVVSSAFDQLLDLGGSRLSTALREFFTERNAPTVLVIDSLDEASGSDDRLRQADTLPWRIILTSRPSSWDLQLHIEGKRDSSLVAELRPLRYPADVESFIHRWFANDPGRADDLVAQIARRPSLQQAATVPLILAFYCIVGNDQPLPDFRRDLYSRVIRRMLTGRWRGSRNPPDVGSCLRMLRAWAWSGASNDPVSGVGTWADDILAGGLTLGQAEREAAGHVAMPAGLPDLDTEMTPRRFIHRSLREHLVAEHIATLPVGEAAQELLPHLWHDRDWEYTVPAAIAMHPRRDQLLRDLICSAAQSRQIPANLSLIDAGWQVRELLARIASETYESDWSHEIAEMIGRARAELARSARTRELSATPDWATSNGQIRAVFLKLLTDEARTWRATSLAASVAQFYPTAHDSHLVARALLELLTNRDGDGSARSEVASQLVQLTLSAEDKRLVCSALLKQMLAETNAWTTCDLAEAVLKLDPIAENRRPTRSALLRYLANPPNFGNSEHNLEWRVAMLLRRAEEDPREIRRELLDLLDHQVHAPGAVSLACALAWLDPTEDDACRARRMLLHLLDRQNIARNAASLARGLAWFDPTAQDNHRARGILLDLLDRQENAHHAADLARALISLDPTAQDNHRACSTFIKMLLDHMVHRAEHPRDIAEFVASLVALTPTAADRSEALQRLLAGLWDLIGQENVAIVAQELKDLVIQLTCTSEDRRQARDVLLRIAAGRYRFEPDQRLTEAIVQLASSPEDKREALSALLELVHTESGAEWAYATAWGLPQLAFTSEDRRQARGVLLAIMTGQQRNYYGAAMMKAIVQLAPSSEDKRQVRGMLLTRMTTEPDTAWVRELAAGVAELDPTTEDKRQVRSMLLTRMTTEPDHRSVCDLAVGLTQLDPTAEDRHQGCNILTRLLALNSDGGALFKSIFHAIEQLNPTVDDLGGWRNWKDPFPVALLAAARRNSPLAHWLAVLPSYATWHLASN